MTWSAERWAIEITRVLNLTFGVERFPIDIPQLALEYTRQRFSEDPILTVTGGNLPGFDGALYPARGNRRGWRIVYNDALNSPGRINFTLAHELGHYFLHRQAHPNGFECGQQQVVRWDSEIGQVESQANAFAAGLLMPLDDFRRRVAPKDTINLDILRDCADRYRVSLIAATLRWLRYTERRAVLVVSRDDFILWSRSSEPAFRSRAYFRASREPVEIPPASLAANPRLLIGGEGELQHDTGVWFQEPVREMTLQAEQYDLTFSLLLLGDRNSASWEVEVDEEDTFSRIASATRGLKSA